MQIVTIFQFLSCSNDVVHNKTFFYKNFIFLQRWKTVKQMASDKKFDKSKTKKTLLAYGLIIIRFLLCYRLHVKRLSLLDGIKQKLFLLSKQDDWQKHPRHVRSMSSCLLIEEAASAISTCRSTLILSNCCH